MTEIYIHKDFFRQLMQIYVSDQSGHSTINITLEDGDIKRTEIDHSPTANGEYKPFLEIPLRFGEMFIDLLSTETKRLGLSSKQENLLQGRIEATEKHLNSTQANFDKLLTAFIESK